MNTLLIIDMVLRMLETFTVSAIRVRQVIETARSEGRDITDEEIKQLQDESAATLESFLKKVKSNSDVEKRQ